MTGLGREIANVLFNKSYNKTNVENKINSVGIDNFTDKILSDDDKKKYEAISKSAPEKDQPTHVELSPVGFSYLFSRLKSLLDKRIVAELLERLKNPEDRDGGLDEELNNWVKQGFDIHKSRNQFKKCFFCENEFSSNFFDSLAKHFSKDYEDLQNSIELLKKDLQKEKLSPIPERNADLYRDLIATFEIQAQKYNEVVGKQNEWLMCAETCLEQKYKNPFDRCSRNGWGARRLY